ncbi:RBBP9/YdeN family alpha/beta hydrolase [Streptomyces sp. NPDC002540]
MRSLPGVTTRWCWWLTVLAAAHWLEQARPDTVAAFLVAPPNPQGPAFPREAASTFLGVSARPLPCPSLMVANDDDPYCDPVTAAAFALRWQARGHFIGSHGHINSDSDLGDWRTGLELLGMLIDCGDDPTRRPSASTPALTLLRRPVHAASQCPAVS